MEGRPEPVREQQELEQVDELVGGRPAEHGDPQRTQGRVLEQLTAQTLARSQDLLERERADAVDGGRAAPGLASRPTGPLEPFERQQARTAVVHAPSRLSCTRRWGR